MDWPNCLNFLFTELAMARSRFDIRMNFPLDRLLGCQLVCLS